MSGFKDGINYCVGLFVYDGLGTGFDRDSDILTLEVDNLFRVVIMSSLRFLRQDSKMVSTLLLFAVSLLG